MTVRAYYVAHELPDHPLNTLLLLDDEVPAEAGLINTGYLVELKNPEKADGGDQDADRAR